MVRWVVGIAATTWLLAACTSSSTPAFSEAHQCTRDGGWWRANLWVCEMQGEGVKH
jgi:hypothetical protein